MANMKKQLVDLFDRSLEQLSGENCVREYLSKQAFSPQYVVAIGKAAAQMLEGVPCDENLKQALLISAEAYVSDEHFDPRVTIVLGSHPVPDEKSLAAGKYLLDFLVTVPADARLLFLISGGASAMVEVLEDGVDLARLQEINRWMLSKEMDISNINRIRKRLSKIKGGGLLHYFSSRDCRALYISDVATDDPAVIGSGLLVETVETGGSTRGGPGWLREFMQTLPERESVDRTGIRHEVISSANIAKKSIARMNTLNMPVFVHEEYLDADVASVCGDLISCLKTAPAGIHVWSGEPLVQLPSSPGKGGRMTALALLLAKALDEGGMSMTILCGASDGQDGCSALAGGLVDENTVDCGSRAGMSADEYANSADSATYLHNIGAGLAARKTGTNIADFIIVFKPESTV